MQRLFFTFFLVGIVHVSICAPNCDHLGTIVYEDIGCKAVYEEGNDCPIKFDCEEFSSNNDSCIFRGKRYSINQEVDDNLTFENCYAACRCDSPSRREKYICAVLDCPEWIDEPEKNCYRKYDLEQCCSIGNACPKKEKVEICQFDGKTYHEGELFFPDHTCTKCSCQRGFQGKIQEPFCKRNLCAIQILHADKLENYCAPLYFHYSAEGALCCPNEWICPEGDEMKIKLNPNAGLHSDFNCKFGSSAFRPGEGFDKSIEFYGRERNVSCECILPPLLTCKEN